MTWETFISGWSIIFHWPEKFAYIGIVTPILTIIPAEQWGRDEIYPDSWMFPHIFLTIHGNIMDCLMGIIVSMGFPCPIFHLALSPSSPGPWPFNLLAFARSRPAKGKWELAGSMTEQNCLVDWFICWDLSISCSGLMRFYHVLSCEDTTTDTPWLMGSYERL